MRVWVFGGRDVADQSIVDAAIEASGFDITELVSGGADGVDRLAEAWAKKRGVKITRFMADWRKHGKAAGPIRNKLCGEYTARALPEAACIAIPTGGPGTRNAMSHAKRLELPIHIQAGRAVH